MGGASKDVDVMGGTCNLQSNHGMIKYLGSTSGAVMSESAVEKNQIITKEVSVPSVNFLKCSASAPFSSLGFCGCETNTPPKQCNTSQAPST